MRFPPISFVSPASASGASGAPQQAPTSPGPPNRTGPTASVGSNVPVSINTDTPTPQILHADSSSYYKPELVTPQTTSTSTEAIQGPVPAARGQSQTQGSPQSNKTMFDFALLSMLWLCPRWSLSASLPGHSLTSKGPLSRSKTLGCPSSTLSASPWTISSSRLAIPKHLFRRFNRSLSISIVPITRHPSLSASNLKQTDDA